MRTLMLLLPATLFWGCAAAPPRPVYQQYISGERKAAGALPLHKRAQIGQFYLFRAYSGSRVPTYAIDWYAGFPGLSMRQNHECAAKEWAITTTPAMLRILKVVFLVNIGSSACIRIEEMNISATSEIMKNLEGTRSAKLINGILRSDTISKITPNENSTHINIGRSNARYL